MYAAAGPALRRFVDVHWHMTPHRILITSKLTGKKVTAYIVDWCACHGRAKVNDERLVDLAPAIWDALGVSITRGIMPITVEIAP